MKAGIALSLAEGDRCRRFVAGVHDTDYFAKLPGTKGDRRYVAVEHDDFETRDLWSAAAEFSVLFGGETVVTREAFAAGGLKLGRVARERSDALRQATAAWGWRGVVEMGGEARVSSATPLQPVLGTLLDTLDWAIETTLASVAGKASLSHERADELRTLACDMAESADTLASYYLELAPRLYDFVAGRPTGIEATTTSRLLTFCPETCGLPRFELLDLFLRPETAERAREAYDGVVAHTEVYPLARFGSGAIPFDLVVPGRGRGTVRVAPRTVIVMTPEPIFIDTPEPVRGVADLASAVRGALGEDVCLVGKAITLVAMLSREFVMVFHEGASGYLKHTKTLLRAFDAAGIGLPVNPLLRVRYEPWDAMAHIDSWLRLPEPFRAAFGAEEIAAPSFAARWRSVVAEQRALMQTLRGLTSPIDLIRFLATRHSSSWESLAQEYEALRGRLDALHHEVQALRAAKSTALASWRDAKRRRSEAEVALGRHWRERIFEREASAEDHRHRTELRAQVDAIAAEAAGALKQWRELRDRQDALVRSDAVRKVHERRRAIELEAELERMAILRAAVVVTDGLVRAGHRPSAWWFPLVSPDRRWFHEATCRAHYEVEPLH